MSLLGNCLAASWFVSVCLLPTFGTLARVPCGMQGWCCAEGNRARQLAKRQVMMVVAAMRGGRGVGQQEGSGKEEKEGRKGRRQEGESQRRWGGTGGQEWWELGDGLQSLVSINSCLGVDLCALCFSSYCLGILVGTLPAPKLGFHHHPSRSDLLGKKGKRMEHPQPAFSSPFADS